MANISLGFTVCLSIVREIKKKGRRRIECTVSDRTKGNDHSEPRTAPCSRSYRCRAIHFTEEGTKSTAGTASTDSSLRNAERNRERERERERERARKGKQKRNDNDYLNCVDRLVRDGSERSPAKQETQNGHCFPFDLSNRVERSDRAISFSSCFCIGFLLLFFFSFLLLLITKNVRALYRGSLLLA